MFRSGSLLVPVATKTLTIDCIDGENPSLLDATSVAVNFKDPV